MIEKFRGYYKPVCSICGEELPAEPDFIFATRAMRTAGWKIQKNEDGEFEHICPTCLNGGEDPD